MSETGKLLSLVQVPFVLLGPITHASEIVFSQDDSGKILFLFHCLDIYHNSCHLLLYILCMYLYLRYSNGCSLQPDLGDHCLLDATMYDYFTSLRINCLYFLAM